MPRNQRQQLQDHSPLLYSSLTTRHSSYPTWVLVVSSPFPHVIRRNELGNEVAQLLLSSNRGFKVPPYVNDIATGRGGPSGQRSRALPHGRNRPTAETGGQVAASLRAAGYPLHRSSAR